MTPRVRFEDEADSEYREAGRWYEIRRPALGLEFFDEVDSTIRRIVAFPQSAALVPGLPPDLPVRRAAVKRFPYHVVFLQTLASIRILAIAHDRRMPGYWMDRR